MMMAFSNRGLLGAKLVYFISFLYQKPAESAFFSTFRCFPTENDRDQHSNLASFSWTILTHLLVVVSKFRLTVL